MAGWEGFNGVTLIYGGWALQIMGGRVIERKELSVPFDAEKFDFPSLQEYH